MQMEGAGKRSSCKCTRPKSPFRRLRRGQNRYKRQHEAWLLGWPASCSRQDAAADGSSCLRAAVTPPPPRSRHRAGVSVSASEALQQLDCVAISFGIGGRTSSQQQLHAQPAAESAINSRQRIRPGFAWHARWASRRMQHQHCMLTRLTKPHDSTDNQPAAEAPLHQNPLPEAGASMRVHANVR